MLAVENLRQSFGSLIVLEELSFSIRSGEFISIVCPSGCGKTVLLRLIAGLLRPSSGKLLVEDEKHHAPRIAYAFQKSPLFPWLSLIENVRICMSGNPLSGDEREKQIFAYFKAAGLSGFEHELPWRISGGMRQKVNVIRAFCSGWPLILMDEPFVSLDAALAAQLGQALIDLVTRNPVTALLVTHDVEEAIALADRVFLLSASPCHVIAEVPISRPRTQRKADEIAAIHAEIERRRDQAG